MLQSQRLEPKTQEPESESTLHFTNKVALEKLKDV